MFTGEAVERKTRYIAPYREGLSLLYQGQCKMVESIENMLCIKCIIVFFSIIMGLVQQL